MRSMKHVYTFLLLTSVAAVVFYRFPEGYVWAFWVLLVLMFVFAGGLLASLYRIAPRRVRQWLESGPDTLQAVGIRKETIRIDALTLCQAAYHDPELLPGTYHEERSAGHGVTDAPFGTLVFAPGKKSEMVGPLIYLEMVQGHPMMRKVWDGSRIKSIDTGRVPAYAARPATPRRGLRFTFDDDSSIWFSVLSPTIQKERFSVILSLH